MSVCCAKQVKRVNIVVVAVVAVVNVVVFAWLLLTVQ